MPHQTSRQGRPSVRLGALLLISTIAITGCALPSPPDDGPSQATPESPNIARRIDGEATALGAIDAPVVMVEFADYRCLHCAQHSMETMPALMKEYVDAGLLRIEWRDANARDTTARDSAVAARAAGRQGLFREYQHALFSETLRGTPNTMDRPTLLGLAASVGVSDCDKFERDLDDHELQQAVRHDADEATALGILTVPTFRINEVSITGARNIDVFRDIIQSELDKSAPYQAPGKSHSPGGSALRPSLD